MHQRPQPKRRRGSHQCLLPGAGLTRGALTKKLAEVDGAHGAGAVVVMVLAGAGAEAAAPAGGAAALGVIGGTA